MPARITGVSTRRVKSETLAAALIQQSIKRQRRRAPDVCGFQKPRKRGKGGRRQGPEERAATSEAGASCPLPTIGLMHYSKGKFPSPFEEEGGGPRHMKKTCGVVDGER
ncbi:hypothetical protein EYF80_019299 [Liparis tanakae]|uniref:Uncharacterized protein n=1 Tax=Liparis tanakae TaxID=230148 RepID=A0A4Z2HZN1_9TELE|nr:hypothetical protein EYF80_019299 [Liparis tanakae]